MIVGKDQQNALVYDMYDSNELCLHNSSKYSHYFCYFDHPFHSFQHFSTSGEKCVFVIPSVITIKTTTTTLPTTMTKIMSFSIVIVCCYIHFLEWRTTSGTSLMIFHQKLVILFCHKQARYQIRILFNPFFRYCCCRSTLDACKVENVFSNIYSSVTFSPHNFNIEVILNTNELYAVRNLKSRERKCIYS